MEEKFNPYVTLNVPYGCRDLKLIKKNYRKQCLLLHPDRNKMNMDEIKEKFITLQACYEYLKKNIEGEKSISKYKQREREDIIDTGIRKNGLKMPKYNEQDDCIIDKNEGTILNAVDIDDIDNHFATVITDGQIMFLSAKKQNQENIYNKLIEYNYLKDSVTLAKNNLTTKSINAVIQSRKIDEANISKNCKKLNQQDFQEHMSNLNNIFHADIATQSVENKYVVSNYVNTLSDGTKSNLLNRLRIT